MHLKLANTASDDWLSAPVVRVGAVTQHLPTPARYGLLSAEGQPALRIEIYADPDEVHAFEQAEIWCGHLVIGFGQRVHVVSSDGTNATSHRLESYFGHLYLSSGYLLVTSAESVRRLDRSGKLIWTSEAVGLDGVFVHEAGPPLVRGEGEWDPPGAPRPFVLDADTGALVDR